MLRIERYEKWVEEKYWACVSDYFSLSEQKRIACCCNKFMPQDFFSTEACFKELILAPYDKIKRAYQYIESSKGVMENECFCINNTGKREKKSLYKKLYDTYEKVSQKLIHNIDDNEEKMNVFLVKQTGFTVCPYCNRDYINCRSEKLAGAQMDHFYPRSRYPVFSLCLYNLVPVCGNCNRIKHDNMQRFASPFDEQIDWENDLKFSYVPLDMNRKKIVINAKGAIKQNVKAMHIETAYQIHEMEVNELLDKVEMYSKTQLEEFREVLDKVELTEQDLKRMVFGSEITEESIKKRPLGKMIRDLERELKIYE
ncbi:MAG: hypothetical protein NC543_01215 [bacterium]|nr:hypothetical protein [bacterium]MCM1375081.1 hypothetical protein [Muribaculum sp.]